MLPSLNVDLEKIRHNSKVVAEKCASVGIGVAGVTKGVLGSPKIARAMLEGGIKRIGDSRLINLKKLKELDSSCQFLMLRQPMKGEVEEVVKVADTSLISDTKAASWLAQAAKARGKKHKVILMVETGDLREGVLPQLVLDAVAQIVKLEGIELEGIGTNRACTTESFPALSKLKLLVEIAKEIENKLGLDLEVISGGNSSVWTFVESGQIPKRINQLRIGEGILLGQETAKHEPISGARTDAFLLLAEVIEVGEKPADGFDKLSGFELAGIERRKQAVVALGRQDVGEGSLKPACEGVEIISISSDHLVLDVGKCEEEFKVGDVIGFIPGYFALLCAFTSPYVEKRIT